MRIDQESIGKQYEERAEAHRFEIEGDRDKEGELVNDKEFKKAINTFLTDEVSCEEITDLW
eukprot:snap_masked-scaffold_1-processed-gene-27.33-mRNA-1 protein AED:1.00 eAED:1.00 QI:0/0/0/0/1/1/2/0/60